MANQAELEPRELTWQEVEEHDKDTSQRTVCSKPVVGPPQKIHNLFIYDDHRIIYWHMPRLLPEDARTVAVNMVLSVLLASNTSFEWLAGSSNAHGIIRYVIPYVKKNQLNVSTSVLLIKTVMDSLIANEARYGHYKDDSTGDASTARVSPEQGMRIMKKLMNSIDKKVEIPAQLAALSILEGQSYWCSHSFLCCFAWDAVRDIQALPQLQPSIRTLEKWIKSGKGFNVSLAMGLGDEEDGTAPGEDDVVEGLFEGDDEDPVDTPDNVEIFVNKKARQDRVLAVSQQDHYAMRGEELAEMCLYEYAGCIKIVPIKAKSEVVTPVVNTDQKTSQRRTGRYVSRKGTSAIRRRKQSKVSRPIM